MNRRIAFALCALAVSGCGGPRATPELGYYDLGAAGAGPNNRVVAALRSVEVLSPSWLASTALQYRLAYRGDRQRQSYAESRWVAPPAELIGHGLRKRMLAGEAAGNCRLRVELDEFIHVFDTPESSRGVMDASVQLVAPGGELLARHTFRVSRPAASADARGAVAALAAAVEDFSSALRAWLGGLDRDGPPGLNIIERCRAA